MEGPPLHTMPKLPAPVRQVCLGWTTEGRVGVQARSLAFIPGLGESEGLLPGEGVSDEGTLGVDTLLGRWAL